MNESRPNNENEYNLDWFKKRAFSTLKRIDENTWDFSDSVLLYLEQSEKEYENIQVEGNPYNQMVTTPEEIFLKEIALNIVERLPEIFEFIDLGPGTAGKEKYIFEAAEKLNKKVVYRPVDISKYYLEKSTKYAKEYNLKFDTLNYPFEELPQILGESSIPRFVSLGLTYSNFEQQSILKLLKQIAGSNGFVFINSQIRDRIDMKKLIEIYSSDAKALIENKAVLLGLDPTKDLGKMITDDGIRAWSELINVPDELKKIGMKEGDRLLVFQSLRPTKESLLSDLNASGIQYEIFDTGSSFIATLLKTN